MAKNLPPLNALRAFEAASRLGSFARAADELFVTSAAVSHQVKQLEHWLGMPLFARNPRGVVLTTAGLEYASRIRDAFDRLMLTTKAVRASRNRAVVTIRSQLSIATLWLLPRLAELNQLRPDIDVKVVADGSEKTTESTSPDISIYDVRSDEKGFVQYPLLRYHYAVYVAPSLLARMPVTHPAELVTCPLVHFAAEDRGWNSATFELWFREAGVDVPPILPGLRVNLMHLAVSACIQGLGFALLAEELSSEAIRNSALAKVPGPTVTIKDEAITMITKEKTSDDVKFVRDWLLGQSNESYVNASQSI
jgi:LysR family transcriptional regulator, glycine cleavage system transcriptional activator